MGSENDSGKGMHVPFARPFKNGVGVGYSCISVNKKVWLLTLSTMPPPPAGEQNFMHKNIPLYREQHSRHNRIDEVMVPPELEELPQAVVHAQTLSQLTNLSQQVDGCEILKSDRARVPFVDDSQNQNHHPSLLHDWGLLRGLSKNCSKCMELVLVA
ncbi:hypothetical protein TanjilG_26652 [Lupinus angustifolius]|uniref:Uncharacterized protein n=1 Tax=Lupinus angustifolius TaxID=3871 RepID=A0A1J7GNL1_LUPAN|nr:hypothetical protein TanjilG_26652 [Lupinus angustifolius]